MMYNMVYVFLVARIHLQVEGAMPLLKRLIMYHLTCWSKNV